MRISGITYVPRKSYRSFNFILLFILLLLSAAISVVLISGYVGWNIVHPQKVEIPAFSSNIVPEFKNVSFQDINKSVELKGWFFESGNSDKTVILAHGYQANRLQFKEKSLDMIKAFLSKGYNVLAFDFRNSGESGGKITSAGFFEKDDLLGAVKYVKARGTKQIYLIGFSTGASASILAAAQSPDINAVIADTPYSDLDKFLEDSLQEWTKLPALPFNKITAYSLRLLAGFNPSEVSPRNAITNLSPKPLLLIHTEGDKLIPSSNSRELYNTYSKINPGKAELWETQGSEHISSYEKYPQDYMDKVLKFLDNSK
ncbi:MAG: alpha/beta hydrolase family protein [Clostridiales bacterium]|nr:alpha/beta hydrolase family protein [Clostridiales bacterium]